MTRAALVGCGEVGRKHFAALSELPNLEVVAICDWDPTQRDRVEAHSSIPRYADSELAVRNERPDIVVVATPPSQTLRIVQECTKFECMVLAEKPVSLSRVALGTAARANWSSRVFVGFQTHFGPHVASLLIDEKLATDKSLLATILLSWRRDEPYYRDWRKSRALAGGILHQHVIHSLALALRLMPADDAICDVEAKIDVRRPWKDIEDEVIADVHFASGRRLLIDAHVDAVHGGNHSLQIDSLARGKVLIAGKNLELGVIEANPAPPPVPTAVAQHALRVSMLDSIATASAAGPVHPCLFALTELVHVLEVIDAIYAESGVVVHS